MTNKDRRFIEYWQDQRKGTKTEYYLTYSIGWTIALFLGLFFLLKIIFDEHTVGDISTLYIIAPVSIVAALMLTHLTYQRNERKYQRLIKQ
jgi:O-antigen/teichoic acid export membrane protein